MDIPRRTEEVDGVEVTLWGQPSDRLLVTVHGKQSHQHDADVAAATRDALARGEQVLTWDLPGHGDRPGTPADCRITQAAAELGQIWGWAAGRFDRQRVFATSLGAYLTLVTAPQSRLDEALFLSPVPDMAALVQRLLDAAGATAEDLRERGRIETGAEPLEWAQHQYVVSHPVPRWEVPTRVLRGSDDDLVPWGDVQGFCARSGAALTVASRAGHYFHTPGDLDALTAWLAAPQHPSCEQSGGAVH